LLEFKKKDKKPFTSLLQKGLAGFEGFSPPTGREGRRTGRAPPGLNPGL
jgi:hypothetical protein